MAMLECTIFERAWYLRSMERLLLDFTDGSAFATTLLDRITERRVVQARHYARCGADVICLGDDVGTQRGMLMSVRMWRTWLKPRLARVDRRGPRASGPTSSSSTTATATSRPSSRT